MITDKQEGAIAAARARKRQDKAHPYLVNIKDGRLMPNVPNVRAQADYRVYDGPINNSRAERMVWVTKALRMNPIKIIDSSVAEDVFDVGTASKDDLLTFAMDQWGMALDGEKSLLVLRKEVTRLASLASVQLPSLA